MNIWSLLYSSLSSGPGSGGGRLKCSSGFCSFSPQLWWFNAFLASWAKEGAHTEARHSISDLSLWLPVGDCIPVDDSVGYYGPNDSDYIGYKYPQFRHGVFRISLCMFTSRAKV